MNTVIHRKAEGITGEQVVSMFKEELAKKESQYQTLSEIEELVNTYAKTPTDNFIVTDVADLKRPICQGDIEIHNEVSDYYKETIDTVMDLRPARDMNLQEGVSVTGDHRIIAISGANMSIQDGRFVAKDGVLGRRPYECKIVETDKPFLIAHREHGNIALPAGKYLVFTQIDTKTQRRVYD